MGPLEGHDEVVLIEHQLDREALIHARRGGEAGEDADRGIDLEPLVAADSTETQTVRAPHEERRTERGLGGGRPAGEGLDGDRHPLWPLDGDRLQGCSQRGVRKGTGLRVS